MYNKDKKYIYIRKGVGVMKKGTTCYDGYCFQSEDINKVTKPIYMLAVIALAIASVATIITNI